MIIDDLRLRNYQMMRLKKTKTTQIRYYKFSRVDSLEAIFKLTQLACESQIDCWNFEFS